MGFFGVKGPKELLASSISAALDEFFIVDPKKIESNLLNDAKIVLNNVRLQPQTSIIDGYTCDTTGDKVLSSNITGSVEEVRFSWVWDMSSSNESWVKDSNLTMKGLRFKALLSYEDIAELEKTEKENNSNKQHEKNKLSKHAKKDESKLTKIKEEGVLQAYVRNQVENIIDALQLVVMDYEFTLELPSSSGIVVGGKKIEIKSLGRKLSNPRKDKTKQDKTTGNNTDNILKQELLIHSLFISVFPNSSAGKEELRLPLLQPFSYQASATRYHGKRFSSFSKSVEFWGQAMDSYVHSDDSMNSEQTREQIQNNNKSGNNNPITLHAGFQQVQILSQLSNIYLTKKPSTSDLNEDSVKEPSINPSTSELVATVDDEKEKDDQFEALKKSITMSSTFQFSLPGISLVLENNTQITLQSLNCHYNADGTVMKFIGTGGSGILVDNYPLVATNNDNDEVSYWVVDLITSTFSIERNVADQLKEYNDTNSHSPIACVRVRKNILRKVYEGIENSLGSSLFKSYDYSPKNTNDTTIVEKNPSNDASNWLIVINNPIEFCFEEGNIEVLEDSVTTLGSSNTDVLKSISFIINSPSFMFGSQIFTCNGIKATSNWLESFSIFVPAIVEVPEEKTMSVNGDLCIDFGSVEDLNKIYEFFNAFDVRRRQNDTYDKVKEKPCATMPADEILLTVPFIILTIQDTDTHINLIGVGLEINRIQIQSSSIQYGKIASASLLGIVTKFDQTGTEVSIRMIDDLKYDDMLVLLEPITNSTVTYNKEMIAVTLNQFIGQLISRTEVGEPQNQNEVSNIIMPFPILFHIDKVSMKCQDKSKNNKETLEATNFSFNAKSSFNEEIDDKNSELFIEVRFDEMHSGLMKLPTTDFSTYVNLYRKELRSLSLSIPQTIHVTVGQSSLLEMIGNAVFGDEAEGSEKRDKYKLPHAKIGKLHFDFSYDAALLSGKGSKLDVAAFDGTSDTLSDDIIAYYHNKVIKQVPGLIRDTSLLGANIVDTSVAFGSYALSANPYTAVFGVLGLDAIFHTLDAGRKSRGADRDEYYKVGDLTRGLKYSMEESTKAGVKMRSSGNEDEDIKGNPFDFVIGSSNLAFKYVDNNKAKLGGAGGAGAGIMIGTVMGGPLGAIAGGIIGGAVTSKVIEETEDLMNKNQAKTKSTNDQHPKEVNETESNTPNGPHGVLFKLGGLFDDFWEPFWCVLDIEKKALIRYQIIENAPPKINLNKFSLSNLVDKLGEEKKKSGGAIQLNADPYELLDLTQCEVEKNKKLSSDELQRFAFTLTFKQNKFLKKQHHFLANTEESQIMWIAMIADMTGNMKSLEKLLESTKMTKS